ncbi:MAG: histidinol-phosphatase HisJ family protein [Ruminococcus sp.]|jgi:histidinol-phosphatase (PHP family)|nr:histidinol-phosphatase HisJ family protein [Ruminococcus sp.]
MSTLIDLHSHSHNSSDARAANFSAYEMVEAAIRAGISIYSITDHCEVNRFFSEAHYGGRMSEYKYETYDNGLDFEKSMAENAECKIKIADEKKNIKFLSGVELGQATLDFGLSESIISDRRLDFTLASVHQLDGLDDFAFIKYNEYSDDDLFALCEKYFCEVKKLCAWGKFDVLGHMTYILRYIEGSAGRIVNINLFYEIIRECFKLLIHAGKGIEVNTSGLRQKYGKTLPDINVLKIYHDVGGKILTLGSDSHTPADVGKGISEASEMIKKIGFKWLVFYEKHEPHFINI